jgi:hypothetical protein
MVVTEWYLADHLGGVVEPEFGSERPNGNRLQGLQDTKVPQHSGRIGADLDACTNLTKFGGLFEDLYLMTGLQQQPSGG